MKTLCTGGCGFIGSHLTEKLLSLGHEVKVLDDLSAGSIDNLKHAYNAEIHVGSVIDRRLVIDLTRNIDTIYHLATLCLVKGLEDPADMYAVNDYGTFNICLAAKKNHCKIVFIGTSEMYGPQLAFPINESNPLKPVSIYGHTKVVAESHVRFFNLIYGVPAVCIRPFNTYGPRQRMDAYAGVITSFSRKMLASEPVTIHGDGYQTRDFTYVSDIVDGIVLLSKLENGQTVNLGSLEETSVLELFDLIQNVTGSNCQPVFDEERKNDLRRLVADNTLAGSYGWKPKVPLKKGIKKYVDWLRLL